MAQLTIPQAAAALGVSVDTVRRRIKAGLLRASRTEHGAYVVEVPDSAISAPEEPRPRATDQHLFQQEQRRASDFPNELRSVRELLEAERRRSAELIEVVAFQRRQLENAEAAREQLLTLLETQQQQFGIEQLQRILGISPGRPLER
jgi:excisionase family DNA binding protein